MNNSKSTAEAIRDRYTEKELTDLDRLRELDAKVRRPATLFGAIFGSISALIMGSGMSLVMTDIGASVGIENALPIGITVGIVGMIMALANYPIYTRILNARKRKYSDEIIELSDRIMSK